MIKSYKDLVVWNKSIELVELIYTLSKQLPEAEKFTLCNQMQRAAISIPSNIAEGSRRGSRKDYRQFCLIALGSCAELNTQLIICRRVYSHIDTEKAETLCEEVSKMLLSLSSRLNSDSYKL